MTKRNTTEVSAIDAIKRAIMEHDMNATYTAQGFEPLFLASPTARVAIIGQAPGIKAQTSGVVWNDASGERLMRWLDMNETTFRDEAKIAHLPMDFYYPGKGVSGDLPPRKEFAPLWHPQLFACMPNIRLILLIGTYAQKYYLGAAREASLTETVRHHERYAPRYFPLVHPSPLNFRWFQKNPWFEAETIPALQTRVRKVLEE